MARCNKCGAVWRTLPGEEQDHGCSRCGFEVERRTGLCPWDGTCRGNDAGRIIEYVNDQNDDGPGERSVDDICAKIGRGSRYVKSIVLECNDLEFRLLHGPVSNWIVVVKK